jgi:NADPH:quinone reductase-like Zn-dependent oxidoreductase
VLLRKRLTLAGTVLRSRPLSEKLAAAQLLAERISPLVAAGSLRPVVHAVLPLARAAEAHAMCEANETFGKVVLSLD